MCRLFHSPPFLSQMIAIWGRCQKLRVRPYYNGYMTGGGGFLCGTCLEVVLAIIYH